MLLPRTQPGRGAVFPEQLLEVVGVREGESLHRRSVSSRELAPVVEGLVRSAVDEDSPLARQHGNDRGVDQGDRRQDERVLAAEQGSQPFLDLPVEGRAAEETGPARVCAPALEIGRDRGDDLPVEVEPEVVARGEVGEPVVADADHAPVDLVDDRIRHRMRALELGKIVAGS